MTPDLRSLADTEGEEVAARIAEYVRRPEAPTVCAPTSMEAHTIAADDFDQTPIFGPCSPVCAYT